METTPVRRTNEATDREWFRNTIWRLARNVHEGTTNLADLRYSLLVDLLKSRFPEAATAHVLVQAKDWYKVASVTRVVDADGLDVTQSPADQLCDDQEEVNELIAEQLPDYFSYVTRDIAEGSVTDAGEEFILSLDE